MGNEVVSVLAFFSAWVFLFPVAPPRQFRMWPCSCETELYYSPAPPLSPRYRYASIGVSLDIKLSRELVRKQGYILRCVVSARCIPRFWKLLTTNFVIFSFFFCSFPHFWCSYLSTTLVSEPFQTSTLLLSPICVAWLVVAWPDKTFPTLLTFLLDVVLHHHRRFSCAETRWVSVTLEAACFVCLHRSLLYWLNLYLLYIYRKALFSVLLTICWVASSKQKRLVWETEVHNFVWKWLHE